MPTIEEADLARSQVQTIEDYAFYRLDGVAIPRIQSEPAPDDLTFGDLTGREKYGFLAGLPDWAGFSEGQKELAIENAIDGRDLMDGISDSRDAAPLDLGRWADAPPYADMEYSEGWTDDVPEAIPIDAETDRALSEVEEGWWRIPAEDSPVAGAPDREPEIRPLTRQLIDSVLMDAWPGNAAAMDFGIVSSDHLGALQYSVLNEMVSPQELDAAMGNGEKLTEIARRGQNPYGDVTFRTPWDDLRHEPEGVPETSPSTEQPEGAPDQVLDYSDYEIRMMENYRPREKERDRER